ncbi:MAG: pilus assembly PilX N-terminal domain-containing protein [Deltaproteobacteria bacterium]|nr:MAG: pilus assembly PilX N-terminal domain-containing protein [Deltaproteobacteria bacterium]
MKRNQWIKSEDGTVLVVALIILVFLTLIGITISATTEVEIQIAGNERLYKENLYTAEAAAMECAQKMEEDPNLEPTAPGNEYIRPLVPGVAREDILNDDYWDNTVSQVANNLVDPDGNSRFLAVEEGVAEGTTLDMTKTTLRSYSIYGRRTGPNQGRSIVRVGYRKAE